MSSDIEKRFNPLPARRPGATQVNDIYRELALEFQSSPSPKAGSYESSIGDFGRVNRFNPLPARRPGATRNVNLNFPSAVVSILSQPEGRELQQKIALNY